MVGGELMFPNGWEELQDILFDRLATEITQPLVITLQNYIAIAGEVDISSVADRMIDQLPVAYGTSVVAVILQCGYKPTPKQAARMLPYVDNSNAPQVSAVADKSSIVNEFNKAFEQSSIIPFIESERRKPRASACG